MTSQTDSRTQQQIDRDDQILIDRAIYNAIQRQQKAQALANLQAQARIDRYWTKA